MAINQELVKKLLSENPNGLTKKELYAKMDAEKPNLNKNKVIEPMIKKGTIAYDGKVYKINPNSQQNNVKAGKSVVFRKSGVASVGVSAKTTKPISAKSNTVPLTTARTITDEEALKFFVYTANFYEKLIFAHRTDPLAYTPAHIPWPDLLKVYFDISYNRDYVDPTGRLSDDEYLFKALILHSQNTPHNEIGDFKSKEPLVDAFCLGYDIARFSGYMRATSRANVVGALQTTMGIGGAAAERFYSKLKAIIDFLNTKPATLSVRNYIISIFGPFMTPTIDYVGIVNRFKGVIPRGFREALSFDFLKEMSTVFDLPKPDQHVKRTLTALFHDDRAMMCSFVGRPLKLAPESIAAIKGERISGTTSYRPNAMGLYLDLMVQVNREAKKRDPRTPFIGNYLLDKMIYLICSGKLYLQNLAGGITMDRRYVKEYLNGILDDSWKATTIPVNLPAFIHKFI